MSNLNEIKKMLYKEKPNAIEVDDGVSGIRGATCSTGSTYEAVLSTGEKVQFYVPHSDMGNDEFEKEIPAQLLIRWLIKITNN